jgi:hypothetical protein
LFGLSARWLRQPFQNRASFAVSVRPTLSTKSLQLLRHVFWSCPRLCSGCFPHGSASLRCRYCFVETARRFTDAAKSQAEIELADRAVALARQISQSVERRIRAGAASTAERNRAAVVLVRARIDAQGSRSE